MCREALRNCCVSGAFALYRVIAATAVIINMAPPFNRSELERVRRRHPATVLADHPATATIC
jgi:hypothetical protein